MLALSPDVVTLLVSCLLYVQKEPLLEVKAGSPLLLSLLEILHNLLRHVSTVVRHALQKTGSVVETEAAEELLLVNKPLTQLNSVLIHMLLSGDPEVYEEASQCLSLLVQMYGGCSPDCFRPEDLQVLTEALELQTHPKQQRLLLRIIKRLVTETHVPDWTSPDGRALVHVLQKLSQHSRSHADVSVWSLAEEILKIVGL
ncbi:serine/threonine-protein kinase ULK4-like [Denticeps clupeoides]|uniref:serine/threonine-protein kinase ULK4-like n=1 Tax=Denticeps clupeoides TaxID=299321 RepID=UPI0010A4525B|nr:serine/threonine-protein kinase ULK4-like [Denticeps clupeoides]